MLRGLLAADRGADQSEVLVVDPEVHGSAALAQHELRPGEAVVDLGVVGPAGLAGPEHIVDIEHAEDVPGLVARPGAAVAAARAHALGGVPIRVAVPDELVHPAGVRLVDAVEQALRVAAADLGAVATLAELAADVRARRAGAVAALEDGAALGRHQILPGEVRAAAEDAVVLFGTQRVGAAEVQRLTLGDAGCRGCRPRGIGIP